MTENILTYSVTNTSLFESFGYRLNSKNVRSIKEIVNETNLFNFQNEPAIEELEQKSYKFFDPNNPYHTYFNQIDMERIFIYGLPMRYYPILEKEQQQFYNDTYGETRDRFYKGAQLEREQFITRLTEIDPIILWGIYNPEPISQELTEFRIDSKKDAKFIFNILYFQKLIKRDPNPGDIIIPWDMPEYIYEVLTVTPSNKILYIPKSFMISASLHQFSK